MAAAAKAEAFYLEQAKLGDDIAAKAFADAGVELAQMTEADFNAWRELAKTSSYPAFVAETPDGQRLLDMALVGRVIMRAAGHAAAPSCPRRGQTACHTCKS